MWWIVLICAVVGSIALSVWRIKKLNEEKKQSPSQKTQARQDFVPVTTVKRTPPVKRSAPLTMTAEQYREWAEGFAANEHLGIDVTQSYNPPAAYMLKLASENFSFDSINKKATVDISVASKLSPCSLGEGKCPKKVSYAEEYRKYI